MSDKDMLDENTQQQTDEADAETETKAETETAENTDAKDYEALLADEKDKYLRLYAEYDNYRKRTSKEKIEAYGDAAAKTIAEILPAIDNFERALDAETDDESYKNGIRMIFNQLQDILKKNRRY